MSNFATHGTLLALGEEPIETSVGRLRLHRFHDLSRRQLAFALACGGLEGPEPLLARVHSSCVTSEALGALDCDCATQLGQSLAEIAAAGRGVVFYLLQEGRGAGLAAKARDRMLVQASGQRLNTFEAYRRMGLGADQRRYDTVSAMCHLLRIEAPLRVMTNNPEKLAALEREAVVIAGSVPLRHPPTPFNSHYIAAKSRSGHALPGAEVSEAKPPRPLESCAPQSLSDEIPWLLLARYWLPVASGVDGGVLWLGAHLYFALQTGEERLVLTYGAEAVPLTAVAIHDDEVRDRFPLHPASRRQVCWRSILAAIERTGSAAVLLRPPSPHPSGARAPRRSLGAADARLLAHHLRGRRASAVAGVEVSAAALERSLARCGVDLERPRGRAGPA